MLKFVQGILWYLGLMQTSELGYGSQTQSAIMSFQEKANLEIDGVVGQFTLKALIGAMYYVEGLDYKTLAWQWNSIYSSEIAGPKPSQKYVDFLPYEGCIGIRKAAWPVYLRGEDTSKAIDSLVAKHFAMSAPAITIEGAKLVDKSVQFATAGLFGVGGVTKVLKVAESSPIKVPADAKIIEQTKTGYQQIKYKWSDGTYKYEARWHTRTPGAPKGQGNTWVITRTTPGTSTGQRKMQHILTGKNQWTPMSEWQSAVQARQNGVATHEQQLLLDHGHWSAP